MSSPAPRTKYCSRCLTTFEGDPESCPNLACRARRRRDGWGELLNPQDVLDRRYKVDRCLAIGGAGATYLAQELSDHQELIGPRLAIKVLYAHRDQGPYLRRLATEAQILTELDHPGIVQILGFVHRAGHSPYLVTRFEEGGSLLDHLSNQGRMSVTAAAAVGVQLCDALSVAHAKGVIHRDMKPENILLTRTPGPGEVPMVRLTDWGIAKVSGGVGEGLTRAGAFVGTPQYAAPEQFEGQSPTASTDLFALAAVLHFCVTLRHLTEDEGLNFDPERTLDSLRVALPPRLGDGWDSAARVAGWNQLLAATMQPDPSRRVSMAQARELLFAIAADLPLPGVGAPATPPPAPPPPEAPHAAEDTFDDGEVIDLSASGALPTSAFEPSPYDGADAPTTLAGSRSADDAPTTMANDDTPSQAEPPPVLTDETSADPTFPPPDPAFPSAGVHSDMGSYGGPTAPPPLPVESALPPLPVRSRTTLPDPDAPPVASQVPVFEPPGPPQRIPPGPPPSPSAPPMQVETDLAPKPSFIPPPDPHDMTAEWPPRRSWFAWIVLGLLLFGGFAGGLGFTAWWVAPWTFPDALLPPARTLKVGSAVHTTLTDAVTARIPALRETCGLQDVGPIELTLTVEPTGRLRRVKMAGVTQEQGNCLLAGLRAEALPTKGLQAVKLGLIIKKPGAAVHTQPGARRPPSAPPPEKRPDRPPPKTKAP
ncbi:MAG: protein kinase [Deltaproteobacteria bacterium]|nr:protein kinase [Deltaproteobacteria bacterium]